MSDTVVVMNYGTIQQIGTPIDIYNEPKNAFVADFIGESNIVDGVMIRDCAIEFCNYKFECVDKGFMKNELVDVVIRPEDIKLVEKDKGMIEGIVRSVVFKGVHYEMIVQSGDINWIVHNTSMKEVGTIVGIDILPNDIHIMRKVNKE